MIWTFLRNRRVRTSNILRTSKGTAWMIAISTYDGVLTTLKAMLPYLFKKANEARAAIDYYVGRISGNELVATFQREVAAGRRERHPRKVSIDIPHKFFEGDRIMKERRRTALRDALGRYRAKVTQEDYRAIRSDHFEGGLPLHELARKYPQYARETIRRVLGGGRGYVGVKGVGRVETTDSR